MANTILSFVKAQSLAIKFWSANSQNEILSRVTYQVRQPDGSVKLVSFARDVDDYTIEEGS